jgi:hypothetical protein
MPDLPAQPAKPSPYDRGTGSHAAESQAKEPIAFITNPPRVDAFNWIRRVASIFAPSGGRTFVKRTDDAFQDQRAPLRIPRALFSGMGKTGPTINIIPDTGSWAFIPGQDISTKNAGRAVAALRSSDDAITIPAIYAGNPSTGG